MISDTRLQDATDTIEELEEEIRAENERRRAFYRMLSATDRVLWRLEELNRDGVKTLPANARIRMRATLDGLPSACLEVFRDSEVVQEVLDSVFDVQERLFRWRVRIEDCSFRMLMPAEIGRGMAFHDEYVVLGNQRERVQQYGQAVTPPVARWLLERVMESLR